MATGAIIARIVTQFSDKGSKAAKKDIAKLGKDFDKFAKRSAMAFAAVTAVVGAFAIKVGKDAVQAAMDDQKSQVLLANSLRNTIKASDATIASTEDFITTLQKQVKITDDELRPSLGRLTAATGSIIGGQQLLGTALDVSADSGADLASSTDAIIKATKGNFKALGLLVPKISAATLKSKDFNKILDQTGKATMGAAAKRAGTLEYQLIGLKIAYGEILETLGYALLPVIQNFADIIQNRVLPQMEAWIAANKDKLASALGTILTTLPLLITAMGNFFTTIQDNLGTVKVFAALITGLFIGGKVLTGINLMSKAIGGLALAYGAMTGSATAAGIAAAFASGGATAIAAGAAIIAFGGTAALVYSKLNESTKAVEDTTKAVEVHWGNVYDSAKKVIPPIKKVFDFVVKTATLTAKEIKKKNEEIAQQKVLLKLKAMGVTPVDDNIIANELEAIRLNLLKEQNLSQKGMYDLLLANYEAQNRINIAAQRYADILMVIADSKISEAEINLLAGKWNLTNFEVAKYIAKVTGNVNLGSGWDAAGLAAGDGWKKALKDLNDYLEAVGKSNFLIKPPVTSAPTSGPDLASLEASAQRLRDATKSILDLQSKVASTNKIPDDYLRSMPPVVDPQTGELTARGRRNIPQDFLGMANGGIVQSPTMAMIGEAGPEAVIPLGQMGSMANNITVNVSGNVTTASDLTEFIRQGLLSGQTSGRGVTTSVLDL